MREGGGVDEGGGSIISGELRGWEGEVGSGKGEGVRCVERRKDGVSEGQECSKSFFSYLFQMIGRVKADPDQLPRLPVSFISWSSG